MKCMIRKIREGEPLNASLEVLAIREMGMIYTR